MSTKQFSVVPVFIIIVALLSVFPSREIVSASALVDAPYDVPASTSITIGETNILALNDSGRSNFMIAQQVTLPESATLQSLSFYIATASGQLRLGVYNNSGNNPGTLVAQTAAFTPTVGWNTQNVITPVLLPAGTYWLAFLPQSNALQFRAETTGLARGFSHTFGDLPASFSGSSQSATVHYSFYATLLVDTPPTSTSTDMPVSTATATNTTLPSNTPTMTSTGTSTNVPAVTSTATNTLLPSNTPTNMSTNVPTQTTSPGSGDLIHLSSASSGTAGGVSFADEDILVYNKTTGAFSLYFDGSDVGLGGSDVDAFSTLSDGSILLSMDTSISVGSLGTVADADIVRFIPTSLGDNTSGTFEWYFDGSDVGLTTSGEDIDAIDFAPDGKLVISTTDTFSVTGGTGDDEDLLVFTSIALGSTTGGTWGLYFDGSDVGLADSSNEDISGVWIDDTTGKLYLSTVGAFSVTGVSGDGADIFSCTPGTLGPTTECTYGPGLYWDGSANGFAGQVVDGIDIVLAVGGETSTPLPTSTLTSTPIITSTNTPIPLTNTNTPTRTSTSIPASTFTHTPTFTPTSTSASPGCTDPMSCNPVSGIPARWVCNIPGCTDPDWIGGVISWPSWSAYSSNARSGNQSRTVYSSSDGSLLYPYMGSWADGCEVTGVSGTILVIEWKRGASTWRETFLSPGESHTIDLVSPEDGALIEGSSTGFSVSLANCTPQNLPPSPTPTVSIVTIGETNILGIDDAGSANLLVAQQAVLSQDATIQSMSFYVATAGGQLQLGIYGNAGGNPGTLLAQTSAFTPEAGWNTQNVQTPVLLPAGTYWLAFLPQSSSMHYRAQTTGSARGVSYTFGAMPAAYPGSPMSATVHWSLYATLTR